MAQHVLRFLAPWCLIAAVSQAQPAQDPRQQELAQIRAEISRLEERLRQMQARETSLEDRLQRVRLELELQESRLSEATAASELAVARATAAEAKVAELETTMAEIRSDLKRRLAGLYRLGRDGYLRLFLSLRPDDNVLPAIRQLRFLVRRDQHALERYVAIRDELAEQRERLNVERLAAEQWQSQEQLRRDDLARLRRRHEQVLAQVERERRRLAERASKLQEKERKLTRLIASLLGDSSTPLAGTPIQEFRGVLDWPLRGKVTVGFGPRTDPQYQTEVPHNGLDIQVQPNAEIRAVFPGQVLYASDFEGYGTMVVLYHPGRVFSLYAGVRELRVGKDDMVSLGDVLGIAAETLYFEIRVESQAEDPRHWLR